MTPLGRAQYLEIMTFLEGYLLHSQGDRMLMGNSIEGRFPFLDYRVAEFAAALPDEMKVRGLQEKYLLRKAVELRASGRRSRRAGSGRTVRRSSPRSSALAHRSTSASCSRPSACAR